MSTFLLFFFLYASGLLYLPCVSLLLPYVVLIICFLVWCFNSNVAFLEKRIFIGLYRAQ